MKTEEFFDKGTWVPKGKPKNWFVYVTAYFIRPVFKVCFRYRVKGAEKLRALDGEPVVFVQNHVSFADPCITYVALYSRAGVSSHALLCFVRWQQACSRVWVPFPSIPILPIARLSNGRLHV